MERTRQDERTAAADRLAAAGELRAAVVSLLEGDDGSAAGRLLDRHVTALVAAGRVDEVLDAVAAVPPGHRGLRARIAEADVQVLLGDVGLVELRVLADDVVRAGGPGAPDGADTAALGWWIAALQAQCLLTQNDVLGAVAAAAVLDEIPGDRLLPDIALQARGRLRVVAAIGLLLVGPAGLASATENLAGALSDLERCGWFTARALAVTAFYFFQVTISGGASTEVQAAVTEARDHLDALGSPHLPLAELVVGLVAYLRGDLTAAVPALQAAAADGARRFAYVSLLAEHMLLLAELRCTADPVPLLARIDDRLGGLRRAFPAGIARPLRRTAEAALDAGLVDVAATYLGRLAAVPAVLPGCEQAERSILRHRVALARGDRSAAAPLAAALDELSSAELPEAAATGARGAAADAERAGFGDLAERFRGIAHGLAGDTPGPVPTRLPGPPPARLTVVPAPTPSPTPTPTVFPTSAASSAPALSPAPVALALPRPPEGRIKVLSPTLVVTIGGRLRRVAANVGRLLVVMAVRPGPMSAEELCGLLWPDTDDGVARSRLKTAIYRLRRQLGLAMDELVVRGGGTISLVPGPNWTVDLHEFWQLATGSGEQRIQAWRLVEGGVCHAQFPYDEVVSEERHAVLARWRRLTDELRSAGLVDEAEAELRSRRLGLAG